MAEPISIQQLKDASEDAISLAEFIYKPANVMIPRRLAADINSLQYYLDYMSSYAQHSYETYNEMVANAPNLPNGVSAFVTNDLDTAKNGIYTYNGTSFVKGDYQPENVAKDFVEAKLGGLEVFDGKVRAQDVSTVDGSTQDVKNTEFRSELDALPFEDGVLADTFVTSIANGAGSVARTQHDKNNETISLEGFGAKEGADNSDAIQAALDYLWNIGGGTLTTNLKNQLISKVCVFHSNTIVDMNNCEITFSAEGCFASAVYNSDKTSYGYASKNPQYYNQSVSNSANNPVSRITSDALLKSDTITVEDTTGLAIGDLLFVSNGYCDMWRVMERYVYDGVGDNKALEDWVRPEVDLWRCEIVKVKAISGNTITLEDELSNDYFAVPKTYGFFSDENNESRHIGYNLPTVERLGGVVNTTFKNIRGILTNGKTAIRANLSVDTHVENSTFKGTGAGVEFNTCYASSINSCTGDTSLPIYILGRGSSNCSITDINTVYNSGDAAVYIFEGAHECSVDNIKVAGKGGYKGAGAAKGGVYFNTCWDCIGTNIIGKNLDAVAMIGFCRGDIVTNNIIGINVDLLIYSYASYRAYGSKGVRRGTYTPTANISLYTNSLIAILESNEIEFKDFYDADSYIVGKTGGRVHIFRSSSVLLDNVKAPNTAIDYSIPDQEKYTVGDTRIIVKNCEFNDGYIMGVYPKYLRHSEIYNTILNGVLYLKEQKNTVLKNVRVLNKAKVATGLSLDSAMYTRIDSCVIRGETYAIDFKAGSASDGSKYGSSTLYMDNTVLEAPTLFKDYVAMEGMYNGSLTTVDLKPMAKSTLLTRYPDLTQFGFMGIDGVTSNWKLIQRAGATIVELRTTEELSSAAHISNYSEYKWLGKEVYNSTTNKFMRARGNTKTAVWQNVDGTDNDIVPV